MPAEHDQIDIERPKIPAWPEDVRQQTVRDESPRRMPNCPPIAAADSVREGRPSGQLWRRICAISLCTGMLAALCFVCGSLLGSAMGGSRWSPELMDFTNFIGILVLFVGMAGAGCVTLKLTTSEDAFSQALKYRVWASVPFSSLQLGVAPPAFQTYLVQGNGHFERHGPAVKKELKASEVILSESVSCTCCLSETWFEFVWFVHYLGPETGTFSYSIYTLSLLSKLLRSWFDIHFLGGTRRDSATKSAHPSKAALISSPATKS
ncbi:unnamed protein product [Durusdinium trenchii]|uniref:Uncharacterized protein n=1 Tax=Durusdinium trenchii TaxID=1381693 RepID=A0ABP0KW00_9DINO